VRISTAGDHSKKLQASMVQLYLVGYFSPSESDLFDESGETVELIVGRRIANPKVVFKRLSEGSGARAWFPESEHELLIAATQIAADLHSQYALAYHPPDPSDRSKYRRIKVRVLGEDVRVRARHGYRLGKKNESLRPIIPERSGSHEMKSYGVPPRS